MPTIPENDYKGRLAAVVDQACISTIREAISILEDSGSIQEAVRELRVWQAEIEHRHGTYSLGEEDNNELQSTER